MRWCVFCDEHGGGIKSLLFLGKKHQMAIQQEQQSYSSFLLDNLFCEEERWEEEVEDQILGEEEISDDEIYRHNSTISGNNDGMMNPSSFPPLFLLEQDLFWEDQELLTLFTKEKHQTHLTHHNNIDYDSSLSLARCEAVEWMLKVNAHYGFSPLTAILAINYFDRFISSLHFQKDKPWTIQLVAVTCLSLAAKVEETQVPLLLDFQVEDTKYVFEAKTIQRMELIVLSTLQWKMNPVTPLSFLDHIIRRLGLKNHLHWEFLRSSEGLLLSIATDSRYGRFLPSVLATATMMNVIEQVEPCNPMKYQNQLMGVLKISKDEVNECCQQLITKPSSSDTFISSRALNKRKFCSIQDTPSGGMIDACLSGNRSNSSWASSFGSSIPSSPEPPLKKIRTHEQIVHFTPLNPMFLDLLASPN